MINAQGQHSDATNLLSWHIWQGVWRNETETERKQTGEKKKKKPCCGLWGYRADTLWGYRADTFAIKVPGEGELTTSGGRTFQSLAVLGTPGKPAL